MSGQIERANSSFISRKPSLPLILAFLRLLLLLLREEVLAQDGNATTEPEECAAQRAAASDPLHRFVTFDAVAPSFGLTNQLLTYVGAMYLALMMNRTLAIPPTTVPNFFDLIDVEATLHALPCSFAITRLENMKKAPTKFPRMRLPGRSTVIHRGSFAREQLLTFARRVRSFRGVRLSTVMWHIPFHAMGNLPPLLPQHITEQFLLRSLVFHPEIRRFAASLRGALPPRFAGLHLRLEEDIRAIQLSQPIRKPSPEELLRLLETCFLQRLPQGVSALYVASGKLEQQYVDVLRRLSLPVVTKLGLGLHFYRTVKADSLDKGRRITNHFEAAADLLVLSESAAVLAADFSTFSRAIQFRRCPTADSNNSSGDSTDDATEAPALLTYNRLFGAVTARHCIDIPTGVQQVPRRGEVNANGEEAAVLISVPWNSMTTYEEITRPFCRL